MDMNDNSLPPSPWQPETRRIRLAVLGKLLEELGECASAASRCIIHGADEVGPEDGKPNRKWLAEEIADVYAMAELAISHFELDRDFIVDRVQRKVAHRLEWHAMIKED